MKWPLEHESSDVVRVVEPWEREDTVGGGGGGEGHMGVRSHGCKVTWGRRIY